MRTEKQRNQLASESHSRATEKILMENRDLEIRTGKQILQMAPGPALIQKQRS